MMEPITRGEIFMATAAGEYSGELPEPVTRLELYWQKIAQRIDAGSSVSPESINTAIADYLNTHDADIVTETELFNALAGKQAVLTAGENIAIVDNNGNLTISATDTTYSAATTSAAGLMSAADKAKLDGIEAGAQVNTVTGVKGSNEAEYRTGNISITKGNVGLGNVDNTADADKPISTAAQTALAGKADAQATQTALAGKQNALTAGANITIETVNDVLTISATDTTYSNATTSAAGLMSAIDKSKLNGCRKIVYLTSEAAYEALNPPVPDTVYMILE